MRKYNEKKPKIEKGKGDIIAYEKTKMSLFKGEKCTHKERVLKLTVAAD